MVASDDGRMGSYFSKKLIELDRGTTFSCTHFVHQKLLKIWSWESSRRKNFGTDFIFLRIVLEVSKSILN